MPRHLGQKFVPWQKPTYRVSRHFWQHCGLHSQYAQSNWIDEMTSDPPVGHPRGQTSSPAPSQISDQRQHQAPLIGHNKAQFAMGAPQPAPHQDNELQRHWHRLLRFSLLDKTGLHSCRNGAGPRQAYQSSARPQQSIRQAASRHHRQR